MMAKQVLFWVAIIGLSPLFICMLPFMRIAEILKWKYVAGRCRHCRAFYRWGKRSCVCGDGQQERLEG